MRIMIRFSKQEAIRYVSHLDLMRAARRMFRRANLPLAYSEGYHPHPILSFAMALPVGAASQGEYMDLSLAESMPCDEILRRLQDVQPQGLSVTGVWVMEEEAPSQMAMVTAAKWRLLFLDADRDSLQQAAARILQAETVMVEKSNGKRIQQVDIRAGIRVLCAEKAPEITALLDAGSRNNIQPQSLSDALLCGPSLGRGMVERTALYGIKDGELVPLENCDGVRHE